MACIKASSLSPAPFHQQRSSPVLTEQVLNSLYLSVLSFAVSPTRSHSTLLSCRDVLQVIHHSSICHNPGLNFDILRVRQC